MEINFKKKVLLHDCKRHLPPWHSSTCCRVRVGPPVLLGYPYPVRGFCLGGTPVLSGGTYCPVQGVPLFWLEYPSPRKRPGTRDWGTPLGRDLGSDIMVPPTRKAPGISDWGTRLQTHLWKLYLSVLLRTRAVMTNIDLIYTTFKLKTTCKCHPENSVVPTFPFSSWDEESLIRKLLLIK